MLMTVLEARVPEDRLADVEAVFRDGMKGGLPEEIVETFLVRDREDPALFRLTTIWKSMEALLAMRNSGVRPKGVLMFEAVDARPDLTAYDVVVHAAHSSE